MTRRMLRAGAALVAGFWLATASAPASSQVLIEMTDEPHLRACMDQHMLHVPGTEREWTAQLALRPDGSVAEVVSVEPALGGGGFETCILEALAQVQLPPEAARQPQPFDYPFTYRVRAASDLVASEDASITERVVATLGEHSDATDACFEGAVASQLPEDTRVQLHVIVEGTGAVRDVTVPASNAGGLVEPCLREAVLGIPFPATPNGAPYAFDYPMGYTRWSSALPRGRRHRRGQMEIEFDPGDFEIEFEIDTF